MGFVPKWFFIPDKCPVCGGWLHHTNAMDVCKLYFVTCSNRRVKDICRWCMLLDFRE